MFSWAGGGWTNAKNLTVACPHHNGRNDDDRVAYPRRALLRGALWRTRMRSAM
ncbi:hypothetical protein [Corynebacterium macginleyi]|uniref:hypothetical protein n=1 Tax=Corynebacterium macginleyi TaxID=38290 RepID=UPI00398A5C67